MSSEEKKSNTDLAEEAMDYGNRSSNSDQFTAASPVVKGKRTKRQRPAAAAPASSISSAELSSSTTEEEEDMANCLILLSRGRALDADPPGTQAAAEETAMATTGKAAPDVYQCKTCNKCFPSFQALGGHRTSHKKPKADEDRVQISTSSSTSKPAPTPSATNTGAGAGSNKPRVHECSICGSEFPSGQALGGHMRRHRPITPAEPPEAKKEKHVLSLDLNLPAPPDDDREEPPRPTSSAMPFPFELQQPLVFSASALVDCHY
ncbi:unnamed protein product [Musa hybrid cultivar]